MSESKPAIPLLVFISMAMSLFAFPCAWFCMLIQTGYIADYMRYGGWLVLCFLYYSCAGMVAVFVAAAGHRLIDRYPLTYRGRGYARAAYVLAGLSYILPVILKNYFLYGLLPFQHL